jgi:hypothetical protein
MYRFSILSFVLISAGIAPVALAQAPQMTAVDPAKGKTGSVLVVTGVHLDKQRVDEVYLSDHTLDLMVKILEQTESSIKFRIPPSVKPGRLQLVVKPPGNDAPLLDQPVWVTVEEDKERSVAAQR